MPEATERPAVMGTRHIVVAGHYLAAQAGLRVLEAGGNAVDAGVCAGLATCVLETLFVGFAGVAPIMIYMSDRDEVVTISGVGPWPRGASAEYFRRNHGGRIPQGVMCTVVPGAPDAWVTALERFGTMSFGDVASAAIELARDGFPMYPFMARILTGRRDKFAQWPSSAALFLPDGRVPAVGERFIQPDQARVLQFLADEERARARRGRGAGLKAVRTACYRGDIARSIVRFNRDGGGWLTEQDLAAFRVGIEPPAHVRARGLDVYSVGAWGQGPSMLQALQILADADIRALGHNSAPYVHALTEVVKIVAADRDGLFGDPRVVDVPLETLLSPAYAAERRALLRPDRAWPDLPPTGRVAGAKWPTERERRAGHEPAHFDTSFLCVADRHGNVFAATPSDGNGASAVVPGLGLVPSWRGQCGHTDPAHPNSVAPGKRPRMTNGPALAVKDGSLFMPFGTPGTDVQLQAMLQVLFNIFEFGMDPQAAVEAPRFASYGFPGSYDPHDYTPGLLHLEGRIPAATGQDLSRLGHKVEWWPDRHWLAGSMGVILADAATGTMTAGADPRRTAYAAGR